MSKNRKKTTLILLFGMLCAFICNLVSRPWHPIRSPESYLWIGVVLFWLYSLRKEIADKAAKRLFYASGVLLVMLFVLRFLKYNYTDLRPETGRLLWYAYYIPICVIPLLSLILSLRMKRREMKRKKLIFLLSVVCAILVILMLSNELHGMAIRVYYENGVEHSAAKLFYYFVLIWSFGMMLVSFFIMLSECRLMQARLHWWIPVCVCLFGMLLLVVYYANGGSSPRIFGVTLYKLQEIILILYLGFWESCILIGLVPTVSILKERNWIGEGIHNVIAEREEKLKALYDSLWEKDDEGFREELYNMATLGVYIKRRANFELISDEKGSLSTKELSLAIRESMEYYSLKGMSVCLEETGEAHVPSLLLVEAYEVFEDVIENCNSACYVKLIAGEDEEKVSFQMRMEADGETGVLQKKHSDFLRFLGADADFSIQDETLLVMMKASYLPGTIRLPLFGARKDSEEKIAYGLSGFADYFSIEKEALVEKIRIHDSMGRSLLLTKRYLSNPATVGRDALMREWGRSLLMYEKNSGAAEPGFRLQNYKRDCIEQAGRLGIEVQLTGPLPSDSYIQEIIDSAITVQITNVIRHTGGKRVYIEAEETREYYIAEFKNDGEVKADGIHETGGLKNLRSRVEMAGGTMEIKLSGGFLLKIVLPRKH